MRQPRVHGRASISQRACRIRDEEVCRRTRPATEPGSRSESRRRRGNSASLTSPNDPTTFAAKTSERARNLRANSPRPTHSATTPTAVHAKTTTASRTTKPNGAQKRNGEENPRVDRHHHPSRRKEKQRAPVDALTHSTGRRRSPEQLRQPGDSQIVLLHEPEHRSVQPYGHRGHLPGSWRSARPRADGGVWRAHRRRRRHFRQAAGHRGEQDPARVDARTPPREPPCRLRPRRGTRRSAGVAAPSGGIHRGHRRAARSWPRLILTPSDVAQAREPRRNQ